MKNAILIIVTVALIGVAAWYFLVYKKPATVVDTLTALDEATYKELKALFLAADATGQFSTWIGEEVAKRYDGRKPLPADNLTNGRPTKTRAFDFVFWSGYIGFVVGGPKAAEVAGGGYKLKEGYTYQSLMSEFSTIVNNFKIAAAGL